jgi:hypothetical protein
MAKGSAEIPKAVRDGARGASLRDVLANLERALPVKSGLRLRAQGEPARRTARAATLWCVIESRSGGHHVELHETVLGSSRRKDVAQWQAFVAKKVLNGWKPNGTPAERDGILEGSIIPGINIRTGKQWSVRMVIGYNLHDSLRPLYTAIHSRRHQA